MENQKKRETGEEVEEMRKCSMCSSVVQKFSLVNEHLEMHKKEQKKKQEIKILVKHKTVN